jgi:hypothetical protein
MATTREELESFQRFASQRLAGAGSEPSLDELLLEWADDRDRLQIKAAIRRGLADIEAGRHQPADVVMEKIRVEFGFPRE